MRNAYENGLISTCISSLKVPILSVCASSLTESDSIGTALHCLTLLSTHSQFTTLTLVGNCGAKYRVRKKER